MFKSRRRKAEEEAKKEDDYRPTSDLEADETNVKDENKGWSGFPLSAIIIFLILVILIVVCIYAFGGPI